MEETAAQGPGDMARKRRRTRKIPSPVAGWLPQWYACEILGCSPSWLYNQRRRGLIPASAMLGSGRGPRIARWWVEAKVQQPAMSRG
jgi:hypothetical protein